MTDRIKSIVETAIAAAGALGGYKFLKVILNRHTDQRRNYADAYNAELDVIRKQYDWLQSKYDALNAKIDELYARQHQLERENLALSKLNNELELKLKEYVSLPGRTKQS